MFNVGIITARRAVPPEVIRNGGSLIDPSDGYNGNITFATNGALYGRNLYSTWLLNAKPNAGPRYTVTLYYAGGTYPTSPSLNVAHSLANAVYISWPSGAGQNTLTALIRETATGKTGQFVVGVIT